MINISKQPFTYDIKQQIFEGFSRHSLSTIGENETFDTTAFVAKDNDTFAGVVVIESFWGALHIKYAYVTENYRHLGLGTDLMKAALEYGKGQNYTFAFVETMSFQALDFYQTLGFSLEFTRPGYAHGLSMHYLSLKFEKQDKNLF